MKRRALGSSGIKVSELGYGAWGIGGSGWLGADDQESKQALAQALDLGVTFIDTALAYGSGHSEQLVGRAIREFGADVVVATKIPPINRRWPASHESSPDDAFPGSWIVECTEQSLANLGRDTLDLQQFHVWSDTWLGRGDWLDAVEELKHDGKIRLFGVSINNHEPESALRLIESGHVDVVQVIYNVFDQSPADKLFAAAAAAGVGVIVRVPFDEGALTGSVRPDTVFPEGDFRNRYFAGDRKDEVWSRAQAIADDASVRADELAELALRFCLTPPEVSTVIPGMRSVRNVERNVQAANAGGLPDELAALLRRHRWTRNFY